MSRYWIFVLKDFEETSGLEIFNHRVKEKFWGLNASTHNARRLRRGDKVIFYYRKQLLGTATIASSPYVLSLEDKQAYWRVKDFKHALGVKLDHIQRWETPKQIEPLVNALRFIMQKSRWQVHFQGGIRGIPESDFSTIIDNASETEEAELFEKNLSWSERREHWIRVPVLYRHLFPDQGPFTVLVDNHEIELKIDRSGRINPKHILWDKFKELLDFDEIRDRLVFAKTADGRIILRKR